MKKPDYDLKFIDSFEKCKFELYSRNDHICSVKTFQWTYDIALYKDENSNKYLFEIGIYLSRNDNKLMHDYISGFNR